MAEYSCKHCGKTFTPKHSKYHTYCSYQCFTDYRNSKGFVPCPICGKMFKPYVGAHGKTKYCSKECQWESLRTYETSICKQCGKEFYPTGSRPSGKTQTYCSQECFNDCRTLYRTDEEKTEAKKRGKRKAYEKQKELMRPVREARERERLEAREKKQKEKQPRATRREIECVCAECGISFISIGKTRKYCATKCFNKRNNRVSELRRREKLKENGEIDWGLSLTKLIKRDKNLCHICGEKCNTKDYVKVDGAFIAGNQYPSIDHLLPVSMGGTHTWDNVKLAHRQCNAGKSNTATYTRADGQTALAI